VARASSPRGGVARKRGGDAPARALRCERGKPGRRSPPDRTPRMTTSTSTLQLAAPWTDALVPRVAAGEERAWRVFHRHYHPVAVAFLRKLGVRDADLEDACQEVFVQAHRYLPSFRGEAQLRTWFYRLCITQAAAARRRGRLTHSLLTMFCRLSPTDVTPPATHSDAAVLAFVASALDGMKEWERLVFVLYEMEGLPCEDIAAIADCPIGTVWRRLHQARHAFRDALALHL
jgi:RNA polymerase sigma-70 factor (ECF subfamily)